jgi:hypothetical protein
MTAFMVIAVVMLMVSMTRRIRRVRYGTQFSRQGSLADQPDQPKATGAGEAPGNANLPPGTRNLGA